MPGRCQSIAQGIDAARKLLPVGRADHEIGAGPAFAEERIAADLAVLVRLFDFAEDVGDLASCADTLCKALAEAGHDFTPGGI